jgi:hypothetical protein
LAEHAEEAVHVKRLEEYVNVGRRYLAAEFAKGDVARIAEDSDLGRAFGLGERFEGIQQFAIIAVADVYDEEIGVVGPDQFHGVIGGGGARYIMPKFSKQPARWGVMCRSISSR